MYFIHPGSNELSNAPQLMNEKLSAMIYKLFPVYKQQGDFWAEKSIYETGIGVITGNAIQHYLQQVQMEKGS